MNRNERINYHSSRRRLAFVTILFLCTLYWLKNLYEEVDSIRVDKCLYQSSISLKDDVIDSLKKEINALKIEMARKPIEVIKPKPKWIKKDTLKVDTSRIVLPVVVETDSVK